MDEIAVGDDEKLVKQLQNRSCLTNKAYDCGGRLGLAVWSSPSSPPPPLIFLNLALSNFTITLFPKKSFEFAFFSIV